MCMLAFDAGGNTASEAGVEEAEGAGKGQAAGQLLKDGLKLGQIITLEAMGMPGGHNDEGDGTTGPRLLMWGWAP